MKTCLSLVLAWALWTNLFAQTATNPPVAEAPQSPPAPLSSDTLAKIAKMTHLFDGQTLQGWIQDPTNYTALTGGDLTNLPYLATKLTGRPDPLSAFLAEQLDEAARSSLAAYSLNRTNARVFSSNLLANLNRIISGPSIYDELRFQKVSLRPETIELKSAPGRNPARLNRLLLEDAYPRGLSQSPPASWEVKDGALRSLGAGRGVLYTEGQYTSYRIIFSIRHVAPVKGGKGDHQACVLMFCAAPSPGEKGLDALGGIQFQVPAGYTWDYRPGKNNEGRAFFTHLSPAKADCYQWSQIEILVDARTGSARLAVAQPVGTRGVEMVDFRDPNAGRTGPFALQMHNAGLFDEYKDIRIETDPAEDTLITTK